MCWGFCHKSGQPSHQFNTRSAPHPHMQKRTRHANSWHGWHCNFKSCKFLSSLQWRKIPRTAIGILEDPVKGTSKVHSKLDHNASVVRVNLSSEICIQINGIPVGRLSSKNMVPFFKSSPKQKQIFHKSYTYQSSLQLMFWSLKKNASKFWHSKKKPISVV